MKKEIDLEIMVMGMILSLIIFASTLISAIQNNRRIEQIKYLEQSLNEQIEEKQVYMNMLEEKE